MPTQSDREILIAELNDVLRLFAIYDEDKSERFKELFDLLGAITNTRYLYPRVIVPKTTALVELMSVFEDKEFEVLARMSKQAFFRVVMLIEQHSIFQNNSKHSQAPVYVQLLVFLSRIGFDGNGASVKRNSIIAGVSVGSVEKYCYRCMIAVLELKNKYVIWPNAIERKNISRRFGVKYGLPNCVGIVDGTPVYFSQKPNIDGEVYWSRKCRYCINLQLICDDRNYITFYQTGWPGSVFDSVVFDNSDVCKNPLSFFSTDEFIIADAGYAAKPFIITPYKQPLASLPHNELFNTLYSSARCMIEHVNGILKGRF
jgi:hypothetical protein